MTDVNNISIVVLYPDYIYSYAIVTPGVNYGRKKK
jgi:hypothetical protein